MVIGISAGVFGVLMSKVNIIMHGFSTPNFPWKEFVAYNPTIQEWFITTGGISIMIIIYITFIYFFRLYPHLEHNEEHAGE